MTLPAWKYSVRKNYTNVNNYFVNYYSHSIKEVDLLYQHLDIFTVDISINGLKPGFLNLPYFELSEIGIMYQWFYPLTIQSSTNSCYSISTKSYTGSLNHMSLFILVRTKSQKFAQKLENSKCCNFLKGSLISKK